MKTKIKTRDIVLIGAFAALTAIGALFLSIPIKPVPITLQTFFTALSGVILGSKRGAMSQLVYVLLGLIGIPVFAGFTGGLGVIASPSFGFLIAFIVGAYVIGKITENLKKENNILTGIKLLAAVFCGYMVIYLIGLPYMYFILHVVMGSSITVLESLKVGMLIFLPGDIVKCIIISIIGVALLPRLGIAEDYGV
ncbi:MAG: biotin transporter BioY [Clostridiaceae bacterium]